jgi:PIN domain nuclease of toxin-antitoxin system
MSAVLDTHALLWYLFDSDRLSPAAYSVIDAAAKNGLPVHISAISLVEIVYLAERNRIPADAFDTLLVSLREPNPAFVVAPVDTEVAEALRGLPREVVSDMPDRIIAATALHLDLPLVTRDRAMRSAGLKTIW